ncbi:hypothetical protein D9757_002503 [Collybiopsis confluens]|uniref:Arrestin-like N-terminal domain-containing protein n=1 Tax=Collybiopsis confluens TaxID=2823264 RepID=A0A8H5HXU5_9AGAR|nr:hypothetical protein D9757_002503 [Collybiopsis confluens]
MYDSPPPLYGVSSDDSDTGLPGYSQAVSLDAIKFDSSASFTHNLVFKGRSSNSCASLTLYGDGSFSKEFPTYLEGSTLRGLVKVNLEKPESISMVVVSIRGEIVSGRSKHAFFESSETLWFHPAKSSRKLQGEHTWPFAMNIPQQVKLTVGPNDSLRPESARLPHDCLEMRVLAGVEYQAAVRFYRPSPLKTDYRIIAPFGYIPVIRPHPPSYHRQIAYKENVEIPNPAVDPQGWCTLPPVWIAGFSRQAVKATCTLSLALPLSYTRGSVIPLYLTLQSEDIKALEALSSPNTIVCRLRRTIRYLSAEDFRETNYCHGKLGKFQHDHFELATWWLPSTQAWEKETFKRSLCGEIVLPRDLKPTTFVGQFRLEYSVVLLSFASNGLESSGSNTNQNILLTHPVQIATAFAPGPLPRSYAPEL